MNTSKIAKIDLLQKQTYSQNKIIQPNKTLTIQEKAKNILASVQHKLLDDLKKQTITIPSKSVPFVLNNQNNKNKLQKQQWVRLHKLTYEKQEMKTKLKEIEKEQKKLKAGLELSGMRQKNVTRLRSELSIEDIHQLKKLKKQQIKFESQLAEKTKIFQQNQKKCKMEEQQLMKKKIEQKNQKKKLQISKRLQELALKQIQRKNKFQQDNKNLTKVNVEKRVHQQLMQKWQKVEKQNQENKRQKYQERKKQYSMDLSQIRQHQKKYEQIIRKNKEDLSRKRLQASRISNKVFKNKLHQSKFYNLVLQQQKQRKKIEQNKKQEAYSLIEKKKQFAEIIKLHFAPKTKIKTQEDQDENLNKRQAKKNPLNFEQLRKKGLEYLQQAKSKALVNRSKDHSFSISKVSHQPQNKIPKYVDYLKQTRKNREQNDDKSVRLQRNFKIQVQQAKRIMKQTSFSDQEKIQRVKILAQRMQFDPQTTKSSTLLKKIQAKMQILQTIQ